MKNVEIKSNFTVYDSLDELPDEDQSLMLQAIEIREKAYAPYSKFKVGAALLLENNIVVLGNNQENAAYPSGLCAERVAIYHAGANHPNKKILKIAISAKSINKTVDTPIAPCGSCRQAIAEYESKQKHPIAIYFMGETGKVVKTDSLNNLLPFSFDKSYL